MAKSHGDSVFDILLESLTFKVLSDLFEDGKLVRVEEEGVVHTTSLRLIPLGTDSNFARTFG